MKKQSTTKLFQIIFVMTLMLAMSFSNSALIAQEQEEGTPEVSDPNDHIEISPALFKAIKDWQAKGKEQRIPLDEFLERSQAVDRETQPKVTKILNQLKGQDRGVGCNCVTVTVNSSFEVAPYNVHQYSPPESQGGLTTWYKDVVSGAATRQRLNLNSPTTNNEFEHGESINGDLVSSNSYARMSFNYLCTNGSLLPEDCACDKILYLKANYSGNSWVSTSAKGGWGNHYCFAAVEDDVAIFSIDQHLTDTQVTVLGGGQYQLSRAQDDTWNPAFWMNIVGLASSIVGVVEDFATVDWSDTVADVGGQIVTVFNTPIDIHHQEESDGSEYGNFAVSYDGGVTLSPNHIVTVAMISKGYIYGKGKGKFVSDSEHKSDYYLSAVLPYNDATPECCIEKYAKWVSGSMGVIGYPNLLNGVEAHTTLWGPWANLTDTNMDGNVDITNAIGYGYDVDQCIVCGLNDITGLTAKASGLNISSNTRPAILSWDGQMYVADYIVNVYDSDGNLIHTYNTTDTTITIPLTPGDYSFTVTAVCENGETKTSSENFFNVKPLFLDGDFQLVRFALSPNPGINEVTVSIDNFDRYRNLEMQIADSYGRVMYQASLQNARQRVNIQNWRKGIYFCTIINNGKPYTQKLIKN